MSFKNSEGAQWSEAQDSGAAGSMTRLRLVTENDGIVRPLTTGTADHWFTLEGDGIIRPGLSSVGALRITLRAATNIARIE